MKAVLLWTCLIAQICFALDRQPVADYQARRQALAAKATNGIVLVFASTEGDGPNDLYGYRPDDNFYYLSGWPEPGSALLIAAANGNRPYTEVFFLPRRNPMQEKWTGAKLGPENPSAATTLGFDQIKSLDDLPSVLLNLLPAKEAKLYTDIPVYDKTSNSQTPLEWLQRTNSFPLRTNFLDVRPLIASLRTFKDQGEVKLIRKATDASVAAHLAAMKTMKPGISERELSALLQYEWGKRGCERPAYAPIVGSGINSTVLHYSDDSRTAQAGETVVIDAGGEYSLYATDITRTLPVSGKFSARQREIYDIVLGAQQAAIEAFKSGKSHLPRKHPDSLYDVAYNYINTHGKDLHGQPLGQYFIHGLSHYVGLNVHDEGDYELPVGPGMVFTIEPGIYIPEEKLGVRIEDTFYVDKDGKLVNLSGALPRTADEVEHAIAGK